MISTPTPPPPPPPPGPPPNPPMFGGNPGTKQGAGAQVNPLSGFGATILGMANAGNTGQKTLLGQ